MRFLPKAKTYDRNKVLLAGLRLGYKAHNYYIQNSNFKYGTKMASLTENWYVIQIINGKENSVEKNIKNLNLTKLSSFLPKRKVKIKKEGISADKIIPLYPGYIFITGQWDLEEAKEIISLKNIINFIGGINRPGMLNKSEKELILSITENNIVEYSKVVKEGSKIRIVSGPLKKLEGIILSVDRRKQRAVVKLPLLNTSIKIVLGFEYIEEKN
jgi:transcription termination/antitermination protein NusG